MKWITPRYLQSEFGLSLMNAEKVIHEQMRNLVSQRNGRSLMAGGLRLLGVFWIFFGARLVAPTLHGWHLAWLELPGVVITLAGSLVLPRLLARDAIISAAATFASTTGTP